MARAATVSFVGWIFVFTSTFLIDHFELFGLYQEHPISRAAQASAAIRTPLHHRFVRHLTYSPLSSRLSRARHDDRESVTCSRDDRLHLCRHLLNHQNSRRRWLPVCPADRASRERLRRRENRHSTKR